MTNVVAINQQSAAAVEEMQKEQTRETIKKAIQLPEVQDAIKAKILDLVANMKPFDLFYHSKLGEAISQQAANPELAPHLAKAVERCLEDPRGLDPIYEAVGFALVQNIDLNIRKK